MLTCGIRRMQYLKSPRAALFAMIVVTAHYVLLTASLHRHSPHLLQCPVLSHVFCAQLFDLVIKVLP